MPVRIAWRATHRPPPLPADLAAWTRSAAALVHWSFYGLLLALPVSGWMLSSNPARLNPMSWFGLFLIPPLPISGAVARLGHEAHGVLGYALIALIILHVAAALRHHFLLHDTVLGRMAPNSIRNG